MGFGRFKPNLNPKKDFLDFSELFFYWKSEILRNADVSAPEDVADRWARGQWTTPTAGQRSTVDPAHETVHAGEGRWLGEVTWRHVAAMSALGLTWR